MHRSTIPAIFTALILLVVISILLYPQKGTIIDPWQDAGGRPETAYSPADDASHFSDNPNYFEWWYFDAQFEECAVAVALHATDVGTPGSKTPHIEVTAHCPNETVRILREYDLKEFRASNETCNVSIAKNRAEGNLSNYHLTVDEDAVRMDLQFDSTVQSWRPGTGTIYFDAEKKKHFSWFVAAPRAFVNGTLTVNGTTFNVTGTGYHDHNWGNIQLFSEISEWYWGRIYTDNLTLIYADIVTADRYGQAAIVPTMLALDKAIVLDSGRTVVKPSGFVFDNKTGNTYPLSLAISFNDSSATGDVAMDLSSLTDSRDLTEGKSWIEQSLAKLFVGHPAYYRFLSNAKGTINANGTVYGIDEEVIHELVKLR
jgi:hypothetical protein